MTKLLIVDDHPIVREGLKAFLELQDDLEVVAETGQLAGLTKLATETEADLILLDIQLEDGNSLTVLPALKALSPEPKVLVLSSFAEESYIREAMRKGASGYLLKHAGPTALLDGIRAVLRGEMPLDKSAVSILAAPEDNPFAELTSREREVLRFISQGLSNKQIAKAMSIAEKTVKTHASSVFAKLKVRDRTQAALLAKDYDI